MGSPEGLISGCSDGSGVSVMPASSLSQLENLNGEFIRLDVGQTLAANDEGAAIQKTALCVLCPFVFHDGLRSVMLNRTAGAGAAA
jgi:hypothetical protein